MTDPNTCPLCGHERTMVEGIFFPPLEDLPYICERCITAAMCVATSLIRYQKPIDPEIDAATRDFFTDPKNLEW